MYACYWVFFSIGPGPGAYMLPPNVGYENHDARKQRMPQYSFGTRSYKHEKLIGPGPGAYKVDTLTRYGISHGNQFTIQGRTYVKGVFCIIFLASSFNYL